MSSRVRQVSSVALTFVARLHAYTAHDGDLGLATGLISRLRSKGGPLCVSMTNGVSNSKPSKQELRTDTILSTYESTTMRRSNLII
ncbi:hypothetical protein C8R48DRAFT_728321 [Suillus tomentosus]|nr:hypothetical protein C8R48DRAFT_728321 [Suillus tomentosus]